MNTDDGDAGGSQPEETVDPDKTAIVGDRLSALLSVDLDTIAGESRRRRRIVIRPDDDGRDRSATSPELAAPPSADPKTGDVGAGDVGAGDVGGDAESEQSTESFVAELAASLGDRAARKAAAQATGEDSVPSTSFAAVGDEATAATPRVDDRSGGSAWVEFGRGASAGTSVDDDDLATEVPVGVEAEGARRRDAGGHVAQSPWRRRVAAAVLVALVLSGIGLAYVGSRLLRDSTEGEVVAPVADPEQAGFEAIVEPTPTFAVLYEIDGSLDAVTVLTLSGTAGGGVVMVPDRTVTELPLLGRNPIEFSYDLGDPAAGAQAVGIALNAGIGEFAVVDDARWAELVGPVAPITIDNPNEITEDGEVRFAVGAIELAAEEVGPYLASRIDGETDLARLFRHQVFWEAWLDAVATDGTPEAVPGELDRGIARFVRSISAGTAKITTLPVVPLEDDAFGDEAAFAPEARAVDDLMTSLIPFPSSPAPGARPRVRVLNGTDDTTEAATLAASLPPLGVSVTSIGNAATANQAITTIEYTSTEFRGDAQAIADFLGVGQVSIAIQPGDSVDITVTLGADYD